MEEQKNIEFYKDHSDSLDFNEMFYVLIKNRFRILFVSTFFMIFFFIYSMLLPNIYESRSILAPVEPQNEMANVLGSYSNLANFAGVQLPSTSIESNSEKAKKKLITLSFFENNFLPNISLIELMAVKKWNPEINKIDFDGKKFDSSTNSWIREYSYPQQLIPSAQESFEVFHNNHFSLSEDSQTGFLELSIRHQSPHVAKYWNELLINEVNNFYRKKDKEEAEKAIKFLNNQILNTNLTEIKQVVASILQQEIQKLMLIEANESYVFEYIDPPAVMEEKIEPRRLFISFIGAIFGFVMSIVIALTNHYMGKLKS